MQTPFENQTKYVVSIGVGYLLSTMVNLGEVFMVERFLISASTLAFNLDLPDLNALLMDLVKTGNCKTILSLLEGIAIHD